jgi:amino acid transporter
LSTGGIIGSGWLFSPFYGFQMAGIWVILSWIISIFLTLIIALSFAETSCLLPITGGVSRFIGVTHNKSIAFIFMLLGWLSLVVYLPLEAQSAIQYLGFWWTNLVVHDGTRIILSNLGLVVAIGIIIFLTTLNCFLISQVTKINSFMGVWKIIIPVGIALFFILIYGNWHNVVTNYQHTPFSFEQVLSAITTSGIAFAFTGFQNGLVMARETSNPKRSLPLSLFSPLLLGGLIYILLSLSFICCLSNPNQIAKSAVAPLLGLVMLFGINLIYVILFTDAVLAPLGTANVFTAVTGRTLYGLALDFMPKSILTKLNRYNAPYLCLWVSAILGMGFLFPFPTWRELVNFLSSVVVFAYISGPVALLILRKEFPLLKRDFKVKSYKLLGYTGFAFCGLFIYWSELKNLCYLLITLILTIIIYTIITKKVFLVIKESIIFVVYVLGLVLISYLHNQKALSFPLDNLLVILLSLICCKILIINRLPHEEIKKNLEHLKLELQD